MVWTAEMDSLLEDRMRYCRLRKHPHPLTVWDEEVSKGAKRPVVELIDPYDTDEFCAGPDCTCRDQAEEEQECPNGGGD